MAIAEDTNLAGITEFCCPTKLLSI
jgi:hypothetical protein